MTSHDHQAPEEHDLGLSHDLPKILGRRGLLSVFGGVGVVALAGCAADDSSSSLGGATDVTVADGDIPEETGGPYPGDGTNGPNVLAESGVVRSDITSSFGDASGVAEGVPVTVRLKVYDLNGDDATPLAGAAVYLRHCDRSGSYSMYDGDAVSENYLRGVQEAAHDGTLQFTTIFPAWRSTPPRGTSSRSATSLRSASTATASSPTATRCRWPS